MRHASGTPVNPTRLFLLTGVLALTACSSTPTPNTDIPASTPPTQVAPKLGVVEIEFSGVGTQLQAKALQPLTSQALTDTDQPCVVIGSSLMQSTVDLSGKRYMQATFPVTNNCTTSLQNLTYVAVRRLGANATLGDSAITSMKTFGAIDAAVAIATQILPTQPVYGSRNTVKVDQATASLQIFDDKAGGELDALQAQVDANRTTYDVLPYGFVTTTSTGSRVIPVGGTGQVTFALSVPLQPSPAQDVFSFRLLANATTNNVTTITQGLEEQDAAGKVGVEARVAALPGAEVRTLLGPTLAPENMPLNSLGVCRVRTAGPRSAPTATLVNVQGTLGMSPLKLPAMLGGTQRQMTGTVTVNGTVFPVPVQRVSLTPTTLSITNNLMHAVGSFPLQRQTATIQVTNTDCAEQPGTAAVPTSPFVSIAGGQAHSLVMKPDGTLTAWGDNSFGQGSVPAGLSGVVAISSGLFYNLALKSDGTVVHWGRNYAGEGDVPAGLSGVVGIYAGQNHAMAVKSDGTVAAWGFNLFGETTVPEGLSGVVAVAAGQYHSLALKADGTVVAWGRNYGGLATVPEGLSGVVAIAAGSVQNVALKADGTVVGWGPSSPAELAGLRSVVAITAGQASIVALKADGTVVSFNQAPGYAVPTGLSDVVAIAAGLNHNLAVKADGSIVAWGYNDRGQTNVPGGLKALVP